MGTRADFYVGRGEKAEWLGSIAWDGYPEGNPQPALGVSSEREYRDAVEAVLTKCADHATRAADGWPWPWEDSRTTDYAYAFDGDRVWVSPFGHEWFDARTPAPQEDTPKTAVFPDMTARARPVLGKRSGTIVISRDASGRTSVE